MLLSNLKINPVNDDDDDAGDDGDGDAGDNAQCNQPQDQGGQSRISSCGIWVNSAAAGVLCLQRQHSVSSAHLTLDGTDQPWELFWANFISHHTQALKVGEVLDQAAEQRSVLLQEISHPGGTTFFKIRGNTGHVVDTDGGEGGHALQQGLEVDQSLHGAAEPEATVVQAKHLRYIAVLVS